MRRALIFTLLLTSTAFGQVVVTVSPGNPAATHRNHLYVLKGATRTFYAAVTGFSTTRNVTWSTDGGTLSAVTSGNTNTTTNWTAPNTVGVYHVTATSVEDNTQTSTATVEVVAPTIWVDIIPFSRVLYKGQIQVLQAIVYGAVDSSVTWTKSGGTFTGSGRAIGFSASTQGTYTVTATSTADPSKSATATIYVTDNSFPGVTANRTQPVDCTAVGNGTTYEVGAGKAYTAIGAVPWNSLTGGDTVRIHPGTYNEQFAISYNQRGTSSQPIRICGVRDASGNLPEINGTGATLRSDVNMYAVGGRQAALFAIGQKDSSSGSSYAVNPPTHPGYVMVEGLKFTTANPSVTIDTGTAYSSAACVSLRGADHLVVVGNEITACTNGIFAAASGEGGREGAQLRSILIEGNYVHDAGLVNNYHDLYVEASGAVFQFNWVGLAASGSSALKTRSYPGFVRYNYIWCNAQCLDVNEPQNSASYTYTNEWLAAHGATDPNHTVADIAAQEEWAYKVYVYGNVFSNTSARTASSGSGLHYSTDTWWGRSPTPGTLYYYANTLHEKNDKADSGHYGDTFMSLGKYSSSTTNYEWSRAEAYNNLVWREPRTITGVLPYWQWSGWVPDRIILGKNWINQWGTGTGSGYGSGFADLTTSTKYGEGTPWPGSEFQQSAGFVTGTTNLVNGANSPAPVDVNMIPVTGSPLINAGQALPSSISDLAPDFYMVPTSLEIGVRNESLTMGAVPSSANTPPENPPDPPTTNGVTWGNVTLSGVTVQ